MPLAPVSRSEVIGETLLVDPGRVRAKLRRYRAGGLAELLKVHIAAAIRSFATPNLHHKERLERSAGDMTARVEAEFGITKIARSA